MKILTKPKSAALLALIALVCLHSFAQSAAPRRVLLVYQSEVYSPAGLEFQDAILTHLHSSMGPDTEFFSEQLEANRFPGAQQQALAWVRSRYAGGGIDLVIFIGSSSLEILPGVPTVCVGFAPFGPAKNRANGAVQTTIWFKVDLTRTIDAARRLQPHAKKILIITGAGFDDKVLLHGIVDQLKALDVPVEYLDNVNVDSLLSRVAHLPPDTIVVPLSYTRDLKGGFYYTPDVVVLLSRASTAPVYAVADTTIGNGTVGGYVVDFDKVGAAVANVAVQTLNGEASANISIPAERISAYRFDWRQLTRWGFSERNLPPDSVVEFKTQTAWELYRWRIVGIVALIIVQSILITALLINRKRRRRAEDSLHDMTGRLLASQDDERRRIARDLHDGTGQHLSGMALTIGQVLADFPPGHDRLQQLLQDSHTASRQALDEVRTVSFVLHPPILDGVGLVSALQWYLDGLQKRTEIKIDFDAPAELGPLSPEAERALFRMVQEGITNVLRHSGGTALKVGLSKTPKTVVLEIEDNGHGLNAEQLARLEGAATLGVGIAGMRERIRQLNGEFTLQSNADGTTVRATVPMNGKPYATDYAGDDHDLTRSGMRYLLEKQKDWSVCGEASNGRMAVEMAEKLRPDVAILDMSMPELNGLEATRQILQILPQTKILIYTMHETEKVIVDVLEAGARGIVLKSDAGDNMITAVETVARGRRFFTSRVAEAVVEASLSKRGAPVDAESHDRSLLTTREREVIQLLAEGKSNKEVADRLNISARTAEGHRGEVMKKLKLGSFAELIRYAVRNGIVQP